MDRIHVMELVRSFQVGEIDRRTFLKRTTAAIGSLAAANTLLAACAAFPNEEAPPVIDESQPAAAPGMETEGDLTVGIVEYPDTDDETLMGYLAYPSSGEAVPAIIVIQEWWGLNDHIKDVARRFANEGFVVLAPDLYHGQVATEPDEARKLVMELDNAEAVKEIEQAIAYLQEQDYVSGDKVGVVGYCMGGGLVLRTALASDDVGAGVVYYGSPLDPAEAGEVKAPILTFVGTEDNIPVDAIEAMHAAFTEAGIKNEYEVYDGAQHAFFNDTRESYNEQAATDAWPRTLAWFHENLS
ncbi:MAG: dienelactone hydrolase family protein [Anaerolineae bacterium]|nr:dienelactone hydrolase family protein [Anaerolineae bacterium]MCB0182003.1 dienelactone hydrolase family protein [Anaerolineae bacterium]MCB9107702.1 dienelactone hydrolase family protein [Anaerolineales bacterium]